MRPEILAPVGSEEALIAAVYSGADAVYFGGNNFNARRKADNFCGENFKKAIAFCRKNGVKSYLTLNTLIKDIEMNEALNLAFDAYRFGINGIIIQDLGLAKLLKKLYPRLPLHASTQLTVHSAAALPFLKELGFCRVVPAREMSKKELEELCKTAKSLNIEVEVFVHGALCMCMSGQCYFSAHLGGRSANRGLCAGTCRLPFSAKGGSGFDLSLKDLSLIDYLEELEKMGVSSFKIEGRLKRPEYVASAVNSLHGVLHNGYADKESRELLEKVFSRSGFTQGYYTENLGKNMFGIRTEADAAQSKEAFNKLHGLYRRPLQRIPVDFFVTIKKNIPITVTAHSGDFTVSATAEAPEKAINRPVEFEVIKNSFSKLGGTPYFLNQIDCDVENDVAVSSSLLNRLRKSTTEKLDQMYSALPDIDKTDFSYSVCPTTRKIKGFFIRFQNINQLTELPDNVIGYSLPAEEIINLSGKIDFLKKEGLPFYPAAELPRGASNDDFTRLILKKLKEKGIKTVVCGNIAAVNLAVKTGLEILGGFGLNVYNSETVKTFKEFGVKQGIISAELSMSEMRCLNTNGFRTYAFCYGRFPLMLTRNCPVKNGVGCKDKKDGCKITDRKGETFPVLCRNGYSEILNSRPTNLADSIDGISADFGYLYFTTETAEEVKRVLEGFENRKITSSTFTRGLSKNGVI